ncbi:hypothetical protein J4212_01850 [Candidatus Woesearchaeota archaeon]|nr:hypothetical protein [Candidatus Woesearchaeota archaeon]
MAKERKIKCDCGSYLQPKNAAFGHFETEAMVCPKCGFTTLTREQAEKFVALKQMHQAIDMERKIIKIGNSIGFTLPEGLQELGAKVGKKVKLEALNENSFKVKLIG